MSYLVLARKYRPKTFAEMVGQEHVVQALGNALRARRLHHAYLFTGTRGVGKTTVSRILAKSLNCTGPDGQGYITDTPCGVCDACREIDAGRFVDYTELDAASNRGVDEVQTLLEQAIYKPVQGRFKVFMIDEVHMLTNTAFNAMLKTLEEPPEYLKFVLATTDPQKVPVTVLSRCLQFNLRPMAPETVAMHLRRVLDVEGVVADDGAIRLLARAARGSMRDALSLTDQAIAFGGGRLEESGVRQMLGVVDRAPVYALLHALAAGDARALVATIDDMRAHGVAPGATLEELTAVLQRLAVVQWTGEGSPDEPALVTLAAALPADVTQLLYSLCLHGRAELGLAPDEYAALTMVLLRALTFMPDAQPVVVAAAVGAPMPPTASAAPQATEKKTPLTPPVAPTPAPTPAAPSETSALPPAVDLADDWERIVDALEAAGRLQALARELALQGVLVERRDGAWRLRVPRQTLAQDGPRERLEAAMAAHLGLPEGWRLSVEVGPAPDSPAERRAARQRARQAEAEAAIRADPLVQTLMREYGATIVPGSIQPVDGSPAA
ncbi:DNA polymerase III subunit tau [Tepidimonas thermarum]|uniref:DNA polymerase III subunit gamma/tau n=1 Tax=Tepidimonas thermarum TaxID=335431 RepID=A0A554X8S5_9BURK|nr:DNA polymerase III subunit gamma/tau [Tepidimonas thermarum]TSE32237.1 DNA polymerase III subunit tau [Tepidimonas thermarum]